MYRSWLTDPMNIILNMKWKQLFFNTAAISVKYFYWMQCSRSNYKIIKLSWATTCHVSLCVSSSWQIIGIILNYSWRYCPLLLYRNVRAQCYARTAHRVLFVPAWPGWRRGEGRLQGHIELWEQCWSCLLWRHEPPPSPPHAHTQHVLVTWA